MKRFLLTIVALLSLTQLSAQIEMTTTSSSPIKQWTGEFNTIDVDAPIKLKLKKCNENQGSYIIYDTKGDYTSKFTAEVNKDKVLKIRERSDSKRETITEVEVYYDTLTDIRIAKADATIEGVLVAELLDIDISNNAHFIAQIETKDLIINITGKCCVTLSGNSLYQTASVSTAEYNALNLSSVSTVVSASHNASVKVDATQRLQAETATGGTIGYKSLPEILRIYIPLFGGEIKRLN